MALPPAAEFSKTTMSSPQESPYALDTPLKALIYYLCVKGALTNGDLKAPSSHKLSARLGNKELPMAPEVKRRWDDLEWMNREKLLFREDHYPADEYRRALSQPGVHNLIRRFRPGFVPDERGYWLKPEDLVDKVKSAARLIALKEVYRFTRDVPQKWLRRFLAQQPHIGMDDPESFYAFVQGMSHIRYISLSKPSPQFDDRDDNIRLEPGPTFRRQDMYVELMALDCFAEDSQPDDCQRRRAQRLELHKQAREFAGNPS